MASNEQISLVRRARAVHGDHLVSYPNVIGIAAGFRQRDGIYTDDVAVQVFVSRKHPRRALTSRAVIPPTVSGPDGEPVPTDVIDAGFMQPIADTATYRPVEGGCSAGTAAVDLAGTLGGWAWDDTDQSTVFLTCNHVLTTSDRTVLPADRSVLQPALLDGGTEPGQVIGDGKRIIPIQVSSATPFPVTAVDCGIGTITASFNDEIIAIGPGIFESEAPVLGMNVQKRGRTTELTTNGRITSLDASWNLNYGLGTATIGSGPSVFNISSTDGNIFADHGDSGSLIFDQSPGSISGSYPAVGLLFAGGGDPFGTLIGASAISSVFSALSLNTLCGGAINELIQSIGTDDVRRKSAQLRRLRDQVLPQYPGGSALADLVTRNAPTLATLILLDETAHDLAVDAFRGLIEQPTNTALLDSRLDAGTIVRLQRLADHVAHRLPEGAPALSALSDLLTAIEGMSITELLEQPGVADVLRTLAQAIITIH
jgi:hypothetical protein